MIMSSLMDPAQCAIVSHLSIKYPYMDIPNYGRDPRQILIQSIYPLLLAYTLSLTALPHLSYLFAWYAFSLYKLHTPVGRV